MDDENTIPFHVANNAATHLGRKLYSTTPPALAELVANSYDAYATKADVVLSNDDQIIVADDGIGMDLNALKNRYAEVGKPKQVDAVPPNLEPRRPMGKKGIGKLASFSLGNSYTVYTRTSASTPWRQFTVNYADMISDEHATQYPVPSILVENLPDYLADFSSYEHGFITVINGLRRKLTSRTKIELRRQLARRFSLREVNFSMRIDGIVVDMQRKELFYDHVQALTYTGYTETGLHNRFGTDRTLMNDVPEDNIDQNLFIKEFEIPSSNHEMAEDHKYLVDENHVRGWVGIFDRPGQLKQVGLGGIVVYINGKVADEDFLKEHKDAQMGNSYIVGEFVADYLNDRSEEPITSSRQGLDESDDDVARLVNLALGMRATAIRQWDTVHQRTAVSKMPDFVRKNEQYQSWLNTLNSTQKDLNRRFLRMITDRKDYDHDQDDGVDDSDICSLVNSFTQVVEQFEAEQLSRQIKLNPDDLIDDTALLKTIATYFGRVATQEKLRQAGIIEQRLRAIENLQKLMANPHTLEKTFEEHLDENPWLLNPYWNQSTKSSGEINVKRQYFRSLYDQQDEEIRRCFMDIYVEVADEEYPIIVELKKNEPTGHAKVDKYSIEKQIDKYRLAIIQHMNTSEQQKIKDNSYSIKAFFIYSEDSGESGQGNRITLTREQREELERMNITLLTYNDLVTHAQQSYREFLNVVDGERKLPYFPIDETHQ